MQQSVLVNERFREVEGRLDRITETTGWGRVREQRLPALTVTVMVPTSKAPHPQVMALQKTVAQVSSSQETLAVFTDTFTFEKFFQSMK